MKKLDMITWEPKGRTRATADLQLRFKKALKDAETPAERRAAVVEARNEWRFQLLGSRTTD